MTFEHLDPPATWAERSMQQWCKREWQMHEAHARHPRYTSIWPTASAFKAHWPGLAADLIEADWKIKEAKAGRTKGSVPYDKIDAPPPPQQSWQERYAAELEAHAGVAWDMAQRNPYRWACKRARLTPPETDIARFWLAGNDGQDAASVTSLARATGEQKRTVKVLLARIKIKFRLLAEWATTKQVA